MCKATLPSEAQGPQTALTPLPTPDQAHILGTLRCHRPCLSESPRLPSPWQPGLLAERVAEQHKLTGRP